MRDHAEEKLQKIKEFQPTSIELLLKESDGEHTNKNASIKIHISGQEIFAEDTTTNFETSINKVVSKARKQIIKVRDKKRVV